MVRSSWRGSGRRATTPDVRATLDTDRLVLVPDEAATVAVQITNSAEVIDGITASLWADGSLQVTCEPQILLLFPDGTGVLMLTLTASATFAAGIHQAEVQVRSSVDPEVLRLALVLEVTPVPAAALSVVPATRTGRTRAPTRSSARTAATRRLSSAWPPRTPPGPWSRTLSLPLSGSSPAPPPART